LDRFPPFNDLNEAGATNSLRPSKESNPSSYFRPQKQKKVPNCCNDCASTKKIFWPPKDKWKPLYHVTIQEKLFPIVIDITQKEEEMLLF
jgi:hypothetical protein